MSTLFEYQDIKDLLPDDIVLAFVNSDAKNYSGYVVAPSAPYAVISKTSDTLTLLNKQSQLSTITLDEFEGTFGYYSTKIAIICKRD